MERWFTADTHFNGQAYFDNQKYFEEQPRPYSCLEEMEEDMISKWNRVVKPGDIVYHLGDFAVAKASEKIRVEQIFKRLNGEKQLVCGNHDNRNPFVKGLGWRWVGDIKHLSVDGALIILCHFPMLAWDGSMTGSWHLHGHTHGLLQQHDSWLKEDVGVDVHEYRPISLDEVRAIMSKRKFVPPDKRRVFYAEDFMQGAVSLTRECSGND